MKFKSVMRYDGTQKIFRLFRIIWTCGKGPGNGYPENYDAVFKLALSKKPFHVRWEFDDKVITILFVRMTYEKSFGGHIV